MWCRQASLMLPGSLRQPILCWIKTKIHPMMTIPWSCHDHTIASVNHHDHSISNHDRHVLPWLSTRVHPLHTSIFCLDKQAAAEETPTRERLCERLWWPQQETQPWFEVETGITAPSKKSWHSHVRSHAYIGNSSSWTVLKFESINFVSQVSSSSLKSQIESIASGRIR